MRKKERKKETVKLEVLEPIIIIFIIPAIDVDF